ncbi:dyp-type peroxidase family protein [Collimonas fungivorans]|uniref:Dyp-type peroxidase family protein n=1 Tax=Collimonas fungivorans TaxID=158899 RepID=A0A127PB72_9BURK|nr:Dyp-type peroxidase domain-containing protein [Collimonas fungivorans]AMO95080.1 dyp-type peroxidase family protein [Collimonas fungivorans]
MVGLGAPLVQALEQHIGGLRPFPALEGQGCAAPSTQQAMWILLRGSDRSSLFERSAQLVELLGEALVLEDAMDTFRYRDSRDLTGYEDGTENPRPRQPSPPRWWRTAPAPRLKFCCGTTLDP